MDRFKSPSQAQRVLAVHDQTAALFRPKRHRLSATSYRHARNDAFAIWDDLYQRTYRVTSTKLRQYACAKQPDNARQPNIQAFVLTVFNA